MVHLSLVKKHPSTLRVILRDVPTRSADNLLKSGFGVALVPSGDPHQGGGLIWLHQEQRVSGTAGLKYT